MQMLQETEWKCKIEWGDKDAKNKAIMATMILMLIVISKTLANANEYDKYLKIAAGNDESYSASTSATFARSWSS